MRRIWKLLPVLLAFAPLQAKATVQYVSGLNLVGSVSATDTFYDCPLNGCGVGTIGNRATALQLDTYILSTLSGTSPINFSAGVISLGNVPVANLNSGTGASSSTFWRGDGTWATPAGGGNVSTSGSITAGAFPLWASGTTLSGTLVPGTGVTTWLATPSSANLAAAVTGETGSGALVFGTSPSLTTPTVAGGALSGTFSGAPTLSGNLTFSGVPNFTGTLTGTQVSCLGLSSGNALVASGSACGSGGATTITLAAGLGNSNSTYNPGTQTVTNGSTIFPQLLYKSVATSCTVNSNCNGSSTNDAGAVLTATAASVTMTVPVTATGIGPFQFGYDGTHSYTLTVSGGTETIYGCGSTGNSITPTYPVQLISDGTNYMCIPNGASGGGGGIGGSGTTNSIPKFTASTTVGNSALTDSGTNVSSSENIDITGNAILTDVANAGTTGTSLHDLAKLTGAPSTAVITASTDTSGIIGIVVAGNGTTGNAQIARQGIALCNFDGTSVVAGDYIQQSSTNNGLCHDAGATLPTSGQILGRSLQSGAGLASYNVLVATEPLTASSGGLSGGTTNAITKWTSSTAVGNASVTDNGTLVNATAEPLLVAQAYSVPSALTDGATIAVNAALSNNFSVTIAGNRTLSNPTNLVAGQILNFIVTQDATGSRTLAFGGNYSGSIILNPAANSTTLFSCYASTSTSLFCTGGAPTVLTASNCSNGASPAVCGSAGAGSVAVPTGTNPTLTVNTTRVNASSQIILTPDESATIGGTTCNTTLTTQAPLVVTARTAGTSFTIAVDATVATNPVCVDYLIVN